MHLQPMSAVMGLSRQALPTPDHQIRVTVKEDWSLLVYSLTDDTTTDLRAERLPPPTRSFPFLLCVQIVTIWRNAVYISFSTRTKANTRLSQFLRVFVILPKYVCLVLEAYFQQSHLKTSSVCKFNGEFKRIFLKNQSVVENCTKYTNIG